MIIQPEKCKTCGNEEWYKMRGEFFCAKCGDIHTQEKCLASGCSRFQKPKHAICIEIKSNK